MLNNIFDLNKTTSFRFLDQFLGYPMFSVY